MKSAWKVLVPVSIAVALLAMVPQGPDVPGQTQEDITSLASFDTFRYVDRMGQSNDIASRNLISVRVLEGLPEGLRLEIHYVNGDYSLVDVNGFHLLRAGRDVQEVRMIRSRHDRMAFPRAR